MTRKKTGTEVVKWEEELAKQADVAAKSEASTGAGQFFSVRSGVLQFDGAPMPGNQMAVVIVDSIFENIYYDEDFDPDSPTSPACFAFGRDEDELAPHEEAVGKQNDTCAGCPNNEWGSADKGRGKACKNTRRIALVPAGSYDGKGNLELFEDVEHYETTPIAFMKLPVTSVRGWATFVKNTANVLRRPPHGVVTRVSVVPDPKSQFKIMFEVVDELPNELIGAVMKRREEAIGIIDFPYKATPEEEKPTKVKNNAKLRGVKKPEAKKTFKR
jgi:hypothetical protein